MILFLFFPCTAIGYADVDWTDSIGELLEHLDLSALQAYLDKIEKLNLWSGKSILSSLIDGDLHIDYSDFLTYVKTLFLEQAGQFLSLFAVIAGVLLIYGILEQVKSSVFSDLTTDVIFYAVYAFILLLLLSMIGAIVVQSTSCVEDLKRQMELCFPILLTLMASSGSKVSVGIYQPIVGFLSTGFTSVISNFIFPLGILVIVLTAVGNLSPELNGKGIKDMASSLVKWVMGLMLSLFSVFITVQGITSAQYDGISLKAAKYAVGSSVPIVGGFLSGGLDLVVAGSILLKNSLGTLSVVLIFFSVAKPVLSIFFFDLFLKFCIIMSDIVSVRFKPVFQELSEGIHFFLSGILCVAYFYLIIVLLLVCTGVALV